jgi:hypothetical protein
MSATLDDIKIDLDEIDRALADKGKKGAPKDDPEVVHAEAAPKIEEKTVLEPDEGVAKLKKQLDDERLRADTAESRAREAAESEVRARVEVQDNQLHLLTTAIEQKEQEREILKANYAQALTDQDFKAAADIQLEMSDNSANLLQLKQGKTALERQPKPQLRVQPDIVDQFVQSMTPRSASWVKSHPEFVRDPKKNAKMIAAHNFIKDDVQVDSDEYFSKIEEMLGIKAIEIPNTEEIDPMADAAKPTRKPAPPAAPVTRSGNGAGVRPNVVTLTADQREAARNSGLTDEEYARNLIALRKEGRLNS